MSKGTRRFGMPLLIAPFLILMGRTETCALVGVGPVGSFWESK